MKGLSKLVLVIFSIIILVVGVVINLLIINWLDFNTVTSFIQKALTENPTNRIVLIVTEILMFIAIICIFVDSSDKETRSGKDILMQNDNGKLLISRETIENIVDSVVKEFPGAKEPSTKIELDGQNNVEVFVNLIVTKNVVIKELTINMQNRIKEAIKTASDLDVKEVNVRIKNIAEKEKEAESNN